MTKFLRAAGSVAAGLLLAGCASLYANAAPTSTPGASNAADNTTQPTEVNSSITLTIWLPPQFDPASGSLAASLLQSRLDEFSEQHPQVLVTTRVKEESGPGGLLDSLSSAQAAAPLALPDLALLPSGLLPAAAEAGVVYAQDAFDAQLDDNDWYPFALQMAKVEEHNLAIPFAADALVTAHRSTAISQVPPNWVRLMDTRIAFGFAAADPQARFALLQLLALADEDASGESFEPTEAQLLEVFDYLATGQARGVFPFWLTQYQNSEQTWQAFSEGRLPMVSVWTSQLFPNRQGEVSGAPIPTQDGQPFTVVRGWVFAVTTTDGQRAALAAELIDFLTTPEFLAQYSAVAALLPPRPSSLAAWAPDGNQALASQIIASAVPLPDDEALERLGAALSPSVIAVLKQETTPADAVETVLAALAAQ